LFFFQSSLFIFVTVLIGYYTQENENLPLDKRMIEYIRETAEAVTLADGERVSAAKTFLPRRVEATSIARSSELFFFFASS